MHSHIHLPRLFTLVLCVIATACGDVEPKGDPVPNAATNNASNSIFPNAGNGATNSTTVNNGATNSTTGNNVNNLEMCGPLPAAPEQLVGFGQDDAEGFGTIARAEVNLLVIDTGDELVEFFVSGLDVTQYFQVEEEVLFYTDTGESVGEGLTSARLQAVVGATHVLEIAQVAYTATATDEVFVRATLPETGEEVTLGGRAGASSCFEDTECGPQARTQAVHTVNYRSIPFSPNSLETLGDSDIFVLNASSLQYEEVVSGDCVAEGGITAQMTVLVASPY